MAVGLKAKDSRAKSKSLKPNNTDSTPGETSASMALAELLGPAAGKSVDLTTKSYEASSMVSKAGAPDAKDDGPRGVN